MSGVEVAIRHKDRDRTVLHGEAAVVALVGVDGDAAGDTAVAGDVSQMGLVKLFAKACAALMDAADYIGMDREVLAISGMAMGMGLSGVGADRTVDMLDPDAGGKAIDELKRELGME